MADDERLRSRSTDSSAIDRDTRGTVTVHDEPVDGGEEVKVDAGQESIFSGILVGYSEQTSLLPPEHTWHKYDRHSLT